MASTAERNARLDVLVEAVQDWRTKRTKELETQRDLAKKILKGRAGSQGLKNETTKKAIELLVDEIDEFLTG